MTAGLSVGSPHDAQEVVASVFVIADASAADLAELGASVRSQAGDIFTATVPLREIERLAACAAVRFVELARPHYPTLDTAVPFSGLGALHAAMPAVDGTGVVVGIVDTALDFYHPDFRDAGSATRVAYLWDQRLSPVGGEAGPPAGLLAPGSMSYGVEYDRAAIDNQLQNYIAGSGNAYASVRHEVTASTDPNVGEHGTHVAGILAGNGRANAGTYTGAAPAADIIFVAYPNLFDTAVLADNACLADGLAYIFARAEAMGKPCVANISVSDDQSAHDGSTAGEQFIDALLTMPGRAVTLSAGNANNISAHAAGNVPAGGTTDLAIVYPAGAQNSDVMEIWYDGQDRFTVTITVPGGPTVIGPIAAGDPAVTTALASGVEVHVTSVVDDPRDHANMISVIVVVPPGQAVPPGTWVLSLAGATVVNGAFDAWVDRNNRTATARPMWQAPHVTEGRLTLGVPATCRNAITVGNHDKTQPHPALQTNSGRGPSRDGRVKPEIATVGRFVNAPRSRNMNVDPTGAAYIMMTGTSQSAPLAAGACALLFQCRGASATWADLKQILEQTAATGGIAAIPDAGFGFGYMSIAGGCAVPMPTVDVWLRDDSSDTGSEPFVGPVAYLSPDIELLDTAGNPVGNPTHDPANRYNNIVRVTVRNRGTQIAHNTEVHLYWADPSTNIAYPADWNDTGIFTASPGFATKGNVVVVPQIAAAGGGVPVEFGWQPPAVGSNISGDDHFCLLVRVENANDASQIGAGGWVAIGARNNLALHNLHVIDLVASGDSVSDFEMVGSDGQDSLMIESTLAFEATLEVPSALLPWRNLAMIEERGARVAYAAGNGGSDWVSGLTVALAEDDVTLLTDIRGARVIQLRDGTASIRLDPRARVVVPTLRLRKGARASGRIRVAAAQSDAGGFVHIGQLSGGRRVGGVSIGLRPRAASRRGRNAPMPRQA